MTIAFHTRYVPVGALSYAVREAGPPDAIPVFLLHGLMDTGASFDALAQAMDKRRPGHFRFIAPDWRGHGDTGALADTYWFPEYLVDLERLIVDCVPERDRAVVLVGHSMGGQVASQYAGVRPTRVSHLITLDSLNVPDADPADTPSRYRRWLDAKQRPPQERVYDDVEAIAARIGKRYPELSEAQRLALASQWSSPVSAVDARRRMRHDVWHRVTFPYGFRLDEAMALWRSVEARVLCLDAADSFMRWISDAQEMARRRACFADVTHAVIPACGHMLHIEQPDRIADQIDTFLAARGSG
ncbi:alpha/beta hydrolase [Salinisphaera sp. T31B1]|uniref:alpha/beta fold hydrolase n=1 Tax=Salinisphaera sp. T31B1 TaxID=727963 RepID=UPI00333E1B6C